jgi:hypothetical protein
VTIDDFEWVEDGFDMWLLMHKQRELAVARIHSFKGWRVTVIGVYSLADPLIVESFDAAKTIATITASNNMEKYHDARNYRQRALRAGPQKIPKGVFKMD